MTYHIFLRKGRNFKASFGGLNSGFAHYMRNTYGMMKIFIFSPLSCCWQLSKTSNFAYCLLIGS